MRWYLSGPMTGLPSLNRPAFHRVAASVRAAGHDALNPAELCPPALHGKRPCTSTWPLSRPRMGSSACPVGNDRAELASKSGSPADAASPSGSSETG